MVGINDEKRIQVHALSSEVLLIITGQLARRAGNGTASCILCFWLRSGISEREDCMIAVQQYITIYQA